MWLRVGVILPDPFSVNHPLCVTVFTMADTCMLSGWNTNSSLTFANSVSLSRTRLSSSSSLSLFATSIFFKVVFSSAAGSAIVHKFLSYLDCEVHSPRRHASWIHFPLPSILQLQLLLGSVSMSSVWVIHQEYVVPWDIFCMGNPPGVYGSQGLYLHLLYGLSTRSIWFPGTVPSSSVWVIHREYVVYPFKHSSLYLQHFF